MIVAWMLYAILAAALAGCAALGAERMLAIWSGGRRFAWLAALIVATAGPVFLATRLGPAGSGGPNGAAAAQTPPSAATTKLSFDLSAIATRAIDRTVGAAAVARAMAGAETFARTAWAVSSATLLLLYAGAMVRLRVQERSWRAGELDGDSVLVAPNLGPAVIGILAPRVVIPDWAFSLEPRARTLMMRHEDEHIRSGDPQLLFLAALSLILFPWNPALWFVVARFRLAIEIDCDARVLLDGDERREYGTLLLAVSARRMTSFPLAAALAEHTPHIERRIIAMTAARPRRPVVSSLAFAGLTLAITAVAWGAPRPVSMRASAPRYANGVLMLPSVAVNSYLTEEQPRPVTLVRKAVADSSALSPARRSREPARDAYTIGRIRTLLAARNASLITADTTAHYYVTVVIDAAGDYVWSTGLRDSWYMFEHRMDPTGGPGLSLIDGTAIGVFDSYADIDVEGGKLAPSVLRLKVITLKPAAGAP